MVSPAVLLRRFVDRDAVIELGTSQATDLSDIRAFRANHICASECSWRSLAAVLSGTMCLTEGRFQSQNELANSWFSFTVDVRVPRTMVMLKQLPQTGELTELTDPNQKALFVEITVPSADQGGGAARCASHPPVRSRLVQCHGIDLLEFCIDLQIENLAANVV